jgi:propanol-preferring alcohol dehydrogenase
VCPYCRSQAENLCDQPLFTGYTRDGGYASATIADARFAFPLGEQGEDVALAPLLCAGLIGWRSLRLAGDGQAIGLYGFGAAGHIVAQVGPFGLCIHAAWGCGDSGFRPQPRRGLGGRIRRGTTAAPRCRDHLCLGGRTGTGGLARRAQRRPRRVCGHSYERHPDFPLWAALGGATLALGGQPYPLEQANQALADLRAGRFEGAAVLTA